MSCVYHGRNRGEGRGHENRFKPPENYYWPFQVCASAVIHYFCHCVSLHEFPDKIFILDSSLANFWERNCPFGCLLVVFWLWCRCFKCVLLFVWWLGRKVLSNCIESWSLPFFLSIHTIMRYAYLSRRCVTDVFIYTLVLYAYLPQNVWLMFSSHTHVVCLSVHESCDWHFHLNTNAVCQSGLKTRRYNAVCQSVQKTYDWHFNPHTDVVCLLSWRSTS